MPALDGAVALAEMDDTAVLIPEDLELDVPWADDALLEVDGVVTEGGPGFRLSGLEKAWEALEYSSWKEYVEHRLYISERGSYNLLTQASDGNVSSAELAKVAGVFGDKQKMVLYLEMSIVELDEHSIKSIRSALTTDLKLAYKRYRPQRLLPSEAQ
ncbi:MAG: hypothetical protein IH805_07905, partial [Proteobacteria bacterium]|nr:hypothetical protein [Pseudomonadota bacterium]